MCFKIFCCGPKEFWAVSVFLETRVAGVAKEATDR
jgi:hypothetical protein